MATPPEIQERLWVRQDGGATGVAHVMLDDRRVGMLAYVEAHRGWDVLAITRRGHYRTVTPSTIRGRLEDWQPCSRSAFAVLAKLLAAEPRPSPGPSSSAAGQSEARDRPVTAATPGDPCEYFGPTLHRGSRGYHVALVQRWLNIVRTAEADRPTPTPELLDPNGHFTSRTTRRVREFQESRGLEVDGRVSPETWRALCSAAQTFGA